MSSQNHCAIDATAGVDPLAPPSPGPGEPPFSPQPAASPPLPALDPGLQLTASPPPPDALPAFPPFPGQHPRASAAFTAYFQLGHTRSLQALAEALGEPLPTIKRWSSKYRWSDRIAAFHSGLLQQQVNAHAARCAGQAANWAARLNELREQEWLAAQTLRGAAQCFLENFGDQEVERMTLSQVSRALTISSSIARSALAGAVLAPCADRVLSPVQQQLLDAIHRVYGDPAPMPTANQPQPIPSL